MNALNIIRKPVVTEKSSFLEENKVYAFWVNPKATKIDIKKAFKSLYGVEVSEVKVITVASKVRKLRKGSYNKRLETRKAYVTLKDKKQLDVNKFEKAGKEKDTLLIYTSSKKNSGPKITKEKKNDSKLGFLKGNSSKQRGIRPSKII